MTYVVVSNNNNSADVDEIHYMRSPQTVVRQAPGFLKLGAISGT